jgi:hypothetical protein
MSTVTPQAPETTTPLPGTRLVPNRAKLAILVLSDPRSESDEALGRLLNALAVAAEAKTQGDEVALVFAGPGTRWPAELVKFTHPARALYDSVREVVVGASLGCASEFGAKEGLEACGVPLLRDHALPNTPGVASLRRFVAAGYQTMIF